MATKLQPQSLGGDDPGIYMCVFQVLALFLFPMELCQKEEKDNAAFSHQKQTF